MASVDVLEHPLALAHRDQAADLRLLVGRITHDEGLRRLGEELYDLFVDRALDEDAAARATVLPRVVEDRHRRVLGEALQVGVGEDQAGALSAELEADALHRVRCEAQDLLPGRRLAREGDLAHTWV